MMVGKIIGKIGNERGEINERRTCRAFAEHKDKWPEWLTNFRPATPEEDGKGYDHIAETDIGKLYLQIKSSQVGITKHKRKYPRKAAIAVVVTREHSLEQVFNACIQNFTKQRKKYCDSFVGPSKGSSYDI